MICKEPLVGRLHTASWSKLKGVLQPFGSLGVRATLWYPSCPSLHSGLFTHANAQPLDAQHTTMGPGASEPGDGGLNPQRS